MPQELQDTHIQQAAGSPPRWIMHVDMDAFFTSIERLDNPRLLGLPIAVGGMTRGVISTASYEARTFGVHSAMPTALALRLCPKLTLLPCRMRRYREASRCVMETLRGFSPLVEQASIDEAYLEATGLERLFGPPEALCKKVMEAVFRATGGLTCSIGLAPVKFLAKIASDFHKPHGCIILREGEVPAFLETLPVGKIPGVGSAFLQELAEFGIKTCSDVCTRPRSFWERRFGKSGLALFLRAQGIDRRGVVPYRKPKSESSETTLEQDTTDRVLLVYWLYRHAERVGRALRQQGFCGRVVTLKIKYKDFSLVTRRISLTEPTCATQTIFHAAQALLEALNPQRPVRLIGVGVSGFDTAPAQGFLPQASTTHEEELRRRRLDKALDAIGDKIVIGRLLRAGEK